MAMKILDIVTNENELQLTIEKTGTSKERVTITFSFEWNHSNDFFEENYTNFKPSGQYRAESLLSGVAFYDGATMTIDEAQKNMLQKFIVHIPNIDTYQLLELCLNAWIKLNKAPLFIQELPHPHYPLMHITHNSIEFPKSKVQELVSAILIAIANSEIHEVETEEEVKEEEEITDLLDDNNAKIIEDELDPEVLALMKQPDDEIKSTDEAMLTFEPGGTEE